MLDQIHHYLAASNILAIALPLAVLMLILGTMDDGLGDLLGGEGSDIGGDGSD